MRLVLLVATLAVLDSTPRAQPAELVTIKGHVDAGGDPLPEGGLWVYVVDKDPRHAHAPRPKLPRAEIRQKDTSFEPHVLVVPKGTDVDFPNKDVKEHNVFSPDPYFDLERYGPGVSKHKKLNAAGAEISIFCDIHMCMWARVKVVDVPGPEYIQAVGRDGSYELHLPPGTYELYAWAVASRDVPSEKKALAAGERWELPTLHLQLGTLDVRHKNKTEQAYPTSTQYQGRCPPKSN